MEDSKQGERERETDTDTDTDTDTERQTQRERDRHTQRERERDRQIDRQRQKKCERGGDICVGSRMASDVIDAKFKILVSCQISAPSCWLIRSFR
eukprot:755824-Hanusia_phi.AAC.2